MIEIIWKPELHSFNSCQEFADEFRLCETDLILTNEYIYQPYFGSMNLGCRVLYQEKYGIGEPTDTMTEAPQTFFLAWNLTVTGFGTECLNVPVRTALSG